MAVSSTTFAAIRNQQVETIRALTPTRLAANKYVYAPTKFEFVDFRTWAEDNDTSCFRQYAIMQTGWEQLSVGDLDVELRVSNEELIIAYPHGWAQYRDASPDTNLDDMSDLIEQDLNLISKAIGYRGAASYLAGQHAAIESEFTIDDGDGVSFGVLPLLVTYYHDA